MTIIINTVAITLYLAAAAYQGRYLLLPQHPKPNRLLIIGFGVIAVCLHAVSTFLVMYANAGIDLGFFKISSLFFCLTNILIIFSTMRRPTENLVIVSFPLASLSMLIATLSTPTYTLSNNATTGMLIHILSSILAYSMMAIAALQACALSLQERQLKHRQTVGILKALPPLQTMESMLFEWIWIGLLLLSVSIATGVIFIEDIFAQHLVHKSVLTIAAWFIFAVLLWGRHQLGWRSQTAVRWTVGGFIALMLGYFGSKLVLEIILQRV